MDIREPRSSVSAVFRGRRVGAAAAANATVVAATADAETASACAEVAAFLVEHRTLSLATVDDDGLPHAAPLLYACDGFSLLWTSAPGTRHSRHIEQSPRVAATIAPDSFNFRTIRGVQIEGRARRLREAPDIARARQALLARYPLSALAEGRVPAPLAWTQSTFYRLDPTCITWIDNTRGFGVRAVLDWAPDGTARVTFG